MLGGDSRKMWLIGLKRALFHVKSIFRYCFKVALKQYRNIESEQEAARECLVSDNLLSG